MFRNIRFFTLILVLLNCAWPLQAQQKPQWLPGQVGLNAGIIPSPGFSYINITANYSAGAFNGPKGSAIPVTGKYDIWAVENFFYYVLNANPSARKHRHVFDTYTRRPALS